MGAFKAIHWLGAYFNGVTKHPGFFGPIARHYAVTL